MGIILWIIFSAIAGFMASRLMGHGEGLLWDRYSSVAVRPTRNTSVQQAMQTRASRRKWYKNRIWFKHHPQWRQSIN